MPLLVNTTTEIPQDEIVPSLLCRLKQDGERTEKVEIAWRVFLEAQEKHRDTLRADIPRLPTETRAIIAATIARLEGRDPTEELEARRKSAVEPSRGVVAETPRRRAFPCK